MKDIDAYIARLPKDAKAALKKLRQAIRKAAPKAEERISYQMPAFFQDGMLVYYAAWKRHIGFYPASYAALKAFKEEADSYLASKGTLKFPLDKPLPLALVGRIVKFRVGENMQKRKKKGSGHD
jgi:uncharacterized protein YdhG (YjbR/CyaY superfamily)